MALIAASIFGAINLSNFITSIYNDNALKDAIQQTSESEGICLNDVARENNLSFRSLASFYADACVSVQINTSSGSWLGSGVCVASVGYEYDENVFIESGSYIVTNYHVIENFYNDLFASITVYPNEYSNYERYEVLPSYDASILWSDSYLDMAILHVKENIDWVISKDRSIFPKDGDALRDWEQAFAIGTPLQLQNQNTITFGKIASSELYYTYTSENSYFSSKMSNIYEDLIAINVPINNGNSGGGLFDSNGYLIGLPTLGVSNSTSSSAVNYAVSIYPVSIILNRLISQQENLEEDYVYVCKIKSLSDLYFDFIDSQESNVMLTNFKTREINFYGRKYKRDDLLFDEEGIKVLFSLREGLKKGDIINLVKINDNEKEITKRNDLIYALLECKAGDTFSLFINGGECITLNVV